jgi:hypothetical protein
VKAKVLLLLTIVEVSEIMHPKFKFLVANEEYVLTLNWIVAVESVPG